MSSTSGPDSSFSARSNGTLALEGGSAVCGDVSWPNWPIHDETEEANVLDVLRSGKWWFGRRVQEFEQQFAAFQGASCAVTCTNGTTAIEMALRAGGVLPGDEVIVPSYTFIATASAVATLGAIPIFADIQPDTLCIDPDDVQRHITSKTSAIVPVHVSGLIADMKRLNEIAASHDLFLMEDAAHAWGSQLEGCGAGTLSRCGTFSFQETKNMTAGEGGILVTDDEEFAERCRSFSHCGRVKGAAWYDHDVLGSNLRMTEFQAAILSAQLDRLESQILRRQHAAARISQTVAQLPGIMPMRSADAMTRRSYHMYIFRLDEAKLGMRRDRLIEALVAEGVPASCGWYRPLYKNRVFQQPRQGRRHGILAPFVGLDVDYTHVSCPVCEQVCRDAVWIPHHVLLADEPDIDKLCSALEKVVASSTGV